MYTMTPMYHMYKDRHMEKLKGVMRHIKLISMNRWLFWMHFEVHEVIQGAVHVHHDTQLPQWLFHSGMGVGMRNSSGAGVGTGVGVNNLWGVDWG
jgi:hypothetical protein